MRGSPVASISSLGCDFFLRVSMVLPFMVFLNKGIHCCRLHHCLWNQCAYSYLQGTHALQSWPWSMSGSAWRLIALNPQVLDVATLSPNDLALGSDHQSQTPIGSILVWWGTSMIFACAYTYCLLYTFTLQHWACTGLLTWIKQLISPAIWLSKWVILSLFLHTSLCDWCVIAMVFCTQNKLIIQTNNVFTQAVVHISLSWWSMTLTEQLKPLVVLVWKSFAEMAGSLPKPIIKRDAWCFYTWSWCVDRLRQTRLCIAEQVDLWSSPMDLSLTTSNKLTNKANGNTSKTNDRLLLVYTIVWFPLTDINSAVWMSATNKVCQSFTTHPNVQRHSFDMITATDITTALKKGTS